MLWCCALLKLEKISALSLPLTLTFESWKLKSGSLIFYLLCLFILLLNVEIYILKYVQLGVMVMVHGDDKGLVLPPKVASVQVIVVPVPYKDADTQGIFDACATTVDTLNEAGIRAEADFRDNYSPGWKYSHWEMKGVPLRIEIGPKDLANSQVS